MTAAPALTPWPGAPYARHAAVLTFALLGSPVPQGSKSFKGMSRSGRAIMVESAKGLKPWRAQVQKTIATAMGQAASPPLGWPLLGPVAIDLVFTVPKPKAAPKTRVTWPIVAPDVDKLVRGVLDAATYAGLWGDDAQVIDVHAFKAYPAETPGALRGPGLFGTVHLIDPHVAPAAEAVPLFGGAP